jgi:hypothetical protein
VIVRQEAPPLAANDPGVRLPVSSYRATGARGSGLGQGRVPECPGLGGTPSGTGSPVDLGPLSAMIGNRQHLTGTGIGAARAGCDTVIGW